MMTDLFRKKDKLLQLLDARACGVTRLTIDNARAAGHPIVMIPIHWAPDAFMSEKQFKEFYWPSFRQMMLDMIAAGLIPMPLWEADCTKRLEVIRDIPPGKCIYWFERTDMVKAFEVLGDVVALRGNLSPSLMTTGTPEEVDAAVQAPGGERLQQGRQADPRLRLRHAGRDADRERARHVRRGAPLRLLRDCGGRA